MVNLRGSCFSSRVVIKTQQVQGYLNGRYLENLKQGRLDRQIFSKGIYDGQGENDRMRERERERERERKREIVSSYLVPYAPNTNSAC